MPNTVYTFILNIYIFSRHFVENIFKRVWALFFWHTDKRFQVLPDNNNKHQSFVYTLLNVQTVIFQTIQFNTVLVWSIDRTLSGAITVFVWPIDRTLSGAITSGQSETGSDGNEGMLSIPQNSRVTGTSPSDYLVSYLGNSLGVLSYNRGAVGVALGDWA